MHADHMLTFLELWNDKRSAKNDVNMETASKPSPGEKGIKF